MNENVPMRVPDDLALVYSAGTACIQYILVSIAEVDFTGAS